MGDPGDAGGGMEGVTCRREGVWAWESSRERDTLALTLKHIDFKRYIITHKSKFCRQSASVLLFI